MSQETILVTGAAGSTARVAIAILLEQGHRVRAMVRKLDARADALRDLGAEVVVADMLDIVAVRAAMRGCSVVYLTMSVSPNYVEAAANVAVTAKGLGVKAFVNLAQMTLSQMSETETTNIHVVDNSRVNTGPIWWEVRPVLVMDPRDWRSADGSTGITSAKVMDDVEAAGRAVEVGSNFFLFFSSTDHSVAAHVHGTEAQGGGK